MQPAVFLRLGAEQDFQGFGGLHAADDADQRREYAEQGACPVVGLPVVK